jgi:hypothetical protein
MKYDHDYTSSDVEDRRGEAGPGIGGGGFSGGGGGGGGTWLLFSILSRFGWKGWVVGLVIVGVGYCAVPMMQGGGGVNHSRIVNHSPVTHGGPANVSAKEAELTHFIEFVFDDVQKTWEKRIPGYPHATLVLFRGSVASACGNTSAAVGPFYCPGDKKVYIDLGFYDELRNQLGAPGDFAQAYVIAHELGHHVQNLRGQFGHAGSVPTELQADCYAGAWAKDANARGEVEVGDIDEAMNAAKQIGDDTLQKNAGRVVRPETFTHGTSAQRQAAFNAGFKGGDGACDQRFDR